MPVSRRKFLMASGAGLTAAGVATPASARPPGRTLVLADRMGPLRPVPDSRDGVPRLALPSGFGYRSFGLAGATMSDGNVCPSSHDGTTVIETGPGHLRLIRNHEVDDESTVAKPLAGHDRAYDRRAGGGTTTVDLRTRHDGSVDVVRDFVSLNGTHTNCSGGRTPWGSWLSCEETVEDDRPFDPESPYKHFKNGYERKHGYIFEVPARANGPVDPVPLVAMGRFTHEAAAVDPRTGYCYLTEDNDLAAFYRFRPHRRGHLVEGGELQALRVKRSPGIDLRGHVPAGTRFDVDWVTIEDPDPPAGKTFEDAAQGVYNQAVAGGAATFTGVEGGTWQGQGHGSALFVSTAGGASKCGQIWAYHPDRHGDDGTLELLWESPGVDVLNYPDAITVSPHGSLVIADDGVGTSLLRGITARGEVFPIAYAVDKVNDPTGPVFSPDGRTLFINLMGEDPPLDSGMSFAVWGRWSRYL